MNNLNSVLIEGVVVGKLKPHTNPDGEIGCKFTLESRRCDVPMNVDVIAYDGKLVERCNKDAGKGRGVRVVGALETDGISRLIIRAEHVEFRPEPKKEAPKSGKTSTRKKQ